MNKERKKTKRIKNSYVKFILIMLLAMLIGGAVGFFMGLMEVKQWSFQGLGAFLYRWHLPLMVAVLLLSVPVCEGVLHKIWKLYELLKTAEDEEADWLEYKIEKYGGIGVVTSNLVFVLMIMGMTFNYNSNYYVDGVPAFITGNVAVALIAFFYQGLWQMRYVKGIQKRDPRLKGDPGSSQKKFQKDWLESCDEAEKELIYQSGYEAYTGLLRWLPAVAVLAMVSHMIWNTGMLAVVLVGIIWMWAVILYSKNCVSKRRKRLNTK